MKKIILFTTCLFISPILFAKVLSYKIEGIEYEGEIINKGKKAATILIVHDWDGPTEYESKRAQMLSHLGYSVFVIDLFGKGVRPTTIEEKKKKTGELYQDRSKMRFLINGAIETAKKEGLNLNKAVMVGYCFGGTSVLEFARSGADFSAFISFHGGLKTPEGQDYSKTKGQIIVFHGSADEAVPLSEFSDLASELEKFSVPHEMITYGGAPHAFSVFGSDRYRENADKKSWQRFTQVLKEVFEAKAIKK